MEPAQLCISVRVDKLADVYNDCSSAIRLNELAVYMFQPK